MKRSFLVFSLGFFLVLFSGCIDTNQNNPIIVLPLQGVTDLNNVTTHDLNAGGFGFVDGISRVDDNGELIFCDSKNSSCLTLTTLATDHNAGGGGGVVYSGVSPVVVDNDVNVVALDVQPSSDWNGLFDGQEGSYYLDFSNATNRLFSLLSLDSNASFDARYLSKADANTLYLRLDPPTTQIVNGDTNFNGKLAVKTLSNNRITYTTTGGQLTDTGNLTFNGSTLGLTGRQTINYNTADTATPLSMTFLPNWTSDVINYFIGQKITLRPKIDTGADQNGYVRALWFDATRYNPSGGDNGYLKELTGLKFNFGNESTDANATIGTAYGISLRPFIQTGIIDTLYDIYLQSRVGGGTLNNYWGIYQEDSDANNYFAGNTGFGTTSPTLAVDTTGSIGATSSYRLSSNKNPIITYDGTTTPRIGDSSGWSALALYDGSTERVRIDKNVGINTTAPDELLHVSTATAGEGAHIGNAYVGVWDGGSGYATFVHNSVKGNTGSYGFMQDSTGESFFNTASGKPMHFRINNVDKAYLSADGNFGIGTTTPKARLDVVNPTVTEDIIRATYNSLYRLGISYKWLKATFPINNTNVLTIGTVNDQDIHFDTNSTTRATIDKTGNIGFGATDPIAKIHVYDSTVLGTTANDHRLLTRFEGKTNNAFQHNQYIVRDSAGSDWTTTRWHDSIGVDSSFQTPGTDTKTWWERDPNNDKQEWGTGSNTYMTLTSSSLNINGDYKTNGITGLTKTLYMRNKDNTAQCYIDVNGGIITASNCT